MKTKTDRAYRGVDPSVLLKSVSVFWTVMGRESLKRWTPEEGRGAGSASCGSAGRPCGRWLTAPGARTVRSGCVRLGSVRSGSIGSTRRCGRREGRWRGRVGIAGPCSSPGASRPTAGTSAGLLAGASVPAAVGRSGERGVALVVLVTASAPTGLRLASTPEGPVHSPLKSGKLHYLCNLIPPQDGSFFRAARLA